MIYPQKYIDFLVYFHGNRDYFECHEILEEYWKEVDSRNKESIWVGLIQLAVANYHHRRGNLNGSFRTLQKSLHILASKEDALRRLGIDFSLLSKQINEQLAQIESKQDYQSMNLPISSQSLTEQCIIRCRELSVEWCCKSDLNNIQIVHRHLKRDRTNVIAERNSALYKKTNRRQ